MEASARGCSSHGAHVGSPSLSVMPHFLRASQPPSLGGPALPRGRLPGQGRVAVSSDPGPFTSGPRGPGGTQENRRGFLTLFKKVTGARSLPRAALGSLAGRGWAGDLDRPLPAASPLRAPGQGGPLSGALGVPSPDCTSWAAAGIGGSGVTSPRGPRPPTQCGALIQGTAGRPGPSDLAASPPWPRVGRWRGPRCRR